MSDTTDQFQMQPITYMSETTIAQKVRTRRLWSLGLFVAFAVLAWVSSFSGSEGPWVKQALFIAGVTGSFSIFLVACTMWMDYCATHVLRGEECEELDKWMRREPEVARYIAEVNAKRNVLLHDYLHVSAWLEKKKEWDAEQACKRVHGIA